MPCWDGGGGQAGGAKQARAQQHRSRLHNFDTMRVPCLPTPAVRLLTGRACPVCTRQDLLLPGEEQGFVTLRCPLRDVEEEDISPHLPGGAGIAPMPGRLEKSAPGHASCHGPCCRSRWCAALLLKTWFCPHRPRRSDSAPSLLRADHAGASAFIDEGLASGGAVLVHCHAGKSRSCSLVRL